jgi:LytS/YehU family sensor histidine kinase
LEKIRYGERLNLNVHIQQDSDHKMISPLLLIPFVENSFKHGTSKMLAHPKVSLKIYVDEETLYFKLINNKPIGTEETLVNGSRGLGLKNVKKRLALLYPNSHELQIAEEPDTYTVWMKIILAESTFTTTKATIKKEEAVYELA